MSNYAIGDVQGCFVSLMALLEKINFNDKQDQLWFVGDLINRGPSSLATLRFLKALPKPAHIVLGNHDLHLLAVYFNRQMLKAHDTITDILQATDVDELCHWLRSQLLLHYDPELNYVMVHAGVAPHWTLAQAQILAEEIQALLRGENVAELFSHLYGNAPKNWYDELTGYTRSRAIINYFTRVRYCNLRGEILFVNKSAQPKSKDEIPWYEIPWRKMANERIIFGHWAALLGQIKHPHLFALDTGCVWGHALTAMRLEDQQLFAVKCERL